MHENKSLEISKDTNALLRLDKQKLQQTQEAGMMNIRITTSMNGAEYLI